MTDTTPIKRGRGRPRKEVVIPDLPDHPDTSLAKTQKNAHISLKHSNDPTSVSITVQPEEEHSVVPKDERKVKFITVARAERYWIDKARKDPAFFCHYLLGKPPARHHLIWLKEMFDYSVAGRASGTYRLNFIAPRDSAKAASMLTHILTPTGWRKMGDLKVGDYVISGNGQKTRILEVQPRGILPEYRITFSDGSSTTCSDDHLWKIHLRTDKTDKWQVQDLHHIRTQMHVKTVRAYVGNDKTQTKSVTAIYEDAPVGYKPYLTVRANREGGEYRNEYRYEIPMVSPVQFDPSPPLPINPYLLGSLLGDGGLTHDCIKYTTDDQETVDDLNSILSPALFLRKVEHQDYAIVGTIRGGRNELNRSIKALGLKGRNSFDKFIPEIYLRASVENRLEILRGLFDTDGTFDKAKRSAVYCTISPTLRDGVVELVQSLGGVARTTKQPASYIDKDGTRIHCNDAYKVTIKLPVGVNPFRLSRKANAFNEAESHSTNVASKQPKRGIVNIEYMGEAEMQCLVVEAEDHTYVTENYIVTHNSTIAVMGLTWFMSRFPFTSNAIISVSAAQSEKRIEMVRDFVAHDPRYHNVFPHIYVDNNQRNNIHEFSLAAHGMFDIDTGILKPIGYNAFRSLVKRVGSGKDPSLYCAGVGGKGVIGRRISGIMLLDDIIDEAYLKANLQDEIYEYMMRTLIPCIMDSAKVINIGTRWMPQDIPEKLKNNSEWKTIEIQAIRHNEVTGEPMSYWPEYWPLEKLERKRLEMDNDALFKVMYLNDPTAFSDAKFTIDGISNELPKQLPEFTQVLVGTDFAISTKAAADWTVFSAIGIDKEKNAYILDMRRIKVTPDVLVKELGAFCGMIADRYKRLDKVLIEQVAFQTSIRFMMAAAFPSLALEPIPPIGDKGQRAVTFAQRSNNNKVFYNHNSEVFRQLKSELMNFGLMGMKDDCVDSISIVFQYINSSIQNVKLRMVRSSSLRL